MESTVNDRGREIADGGKTFLKFHSILPVKKNIDF